MVLVRYVLLSDIEIKMDEPLTIMVYLDFHFNFAHFN
jgi:hypothetical protein